MLSLYGPPGAGKSAVGRRLAETLKLPFLDLDQTIETRAGRRIAEIFTEQGEAGFRALERQTLQDCLSAGAGVLALGGGALLDADNRAQVEMAGPVVCLRASYDVLHERLRSAPAVRPLLAGDPAADLRQLLDRREEHYAAFPLGIDTSDHDPEGIAWEVQQRLGWYHVQGMGKGYDVRVAKGGLERLGPALQARGMGDSLVVISDQTVEALYGERVLQSLRGSGFLAQGMASQPGERAKNLETADLLWQGLLQAGLDRGGAVIALGGGVVGDLAGFVAATYLRGVSWVAVPTTLLGMVDASLGGKTGIDLPQGKNLVGAFHAPRLVLADPDVLSTLPPAELRAGLAEVVKHAVIADPELFQTCAGGWRAVAGDWGAIVRRAMGVKVRVIQEDPFEGGLREVLNLGHTVGHALEQASGYRLPHGEAVALGMVAEARLAESVGLAESGLADRLAQVLLGLGLPARLSAPVDPHEVLEALQVDKKKARGRVRFSLPRRVGEVHTGIEVEDLNEVLTALGLEPG